MSDKLTPVQELEQTKTALSTLQGKHDAAVAESNTNKSALATLQGQFDTFKADANAAKATISSDLIKANDDLVSEKLDHSKTRLALATAQADLSKANGELTPLKANFEEAVTKAASKQAAAATAAIGVEAVKTDVNTKQETTEPKQTGLTGIQRLAAQAEVEARPIYEAANGIRARK